MQNELADVPTGDDEYCECEDEGLEEEFRGDVAVVRLHRRLEPAKLRHRKGENASPDAAEHEVASAAMDVSFEGDDFSDHDLTELDTTGDGLDADEQLTARKKKLAAFVQERCNKKLRAGHGGGVRRTHAK